MQNNCVVLITKHHLKMSEFSFISIGYLSIDPSSSTIKTFACVAIEVTMRKEFQIKEFADTLLLSV